MVREYYKKLRAFYDKILIFDDYKYIVPNYVSGVINPNLHADKKFYCPGIRLFTGRKYLLIRNEFFNINRRKNSNRILLCVGGSDPENQMDRLLSILIKASKRPIDAVFGPGFENLNVKVSETLILNFLAPRAAQHLNTTAPNP